MVNSNYEGFGTGIVRHADLRCKIGVQTFLYPESQIRSQQEAVSHDYLDVPYTFTKRCRRKSSRSTLLYIHKHGWVYAPQGHANYVESVTTAWAHKKHGLVFAFWRGLQNGKIYFEEGFSKEIVSELAAMGIQWKCTLVADEKRAMFGRAQTHETQAMVSSSSSDRRWNGAGLLRRKVVRRMKVVFFFSFFF